MKEIKLLIRALKQYPDNWFVYPQNHGTIGGILVHPVDGLVVKTFDGEEKDFIELGNESNVVL